MIKVGLTGVMGAGKSSVIEILKQRGIVVLDCDKINAMLLQQGFAGYRALVAHFGKDIVTAQGDIDTKKMSALLFTNKKNQMEAEAILHPLIKDEILHQLETYKKEALVVVEVPLLFEVAWQSYFDEVWVIACEEELLLHRLETMRGIPKEEAKRRLALQIPQDEKITLADVVFYNNSDKDNLKQQIYAILKDRI